MLDEYMNNFSNIVSSIFFASFKIIVIMLVAGIVLSLIMLALGCLIKSQKIKSKFLKVVPSLMLITIMFLAIPFIWVQLKNLM